MRVLRQGVPRGGCLHAVTAGQENPLSRKFPVRQGDYCENIFRYLPLQKREK